MGIVVKFPKEMHPSSYIDTTRELAEVIQLPMIRFGWQPPKEKLLLLAPPGGPSCRR